MRSTALKAFYSLLLPAGIPLLGAYFVVRNAQLSGSLAELTRVLAPASLALAAALAWRFKRSRVLLVATVLGIGAEALRRLEPGSGPEAAALIAVTVLIPANLAVVALFRERGIASLTGVLRFLFVAGQIGLVYRLGLGDLPSQWTDWLRARPLDLAWLDLGWIEVRGLRQTTLIAYSGAALIIGLRYLHRRSPIEGGLLGALVASLLALLTGLGSPISEVYWCAAGVVLLFSLVEMTHALAFRDPLTGLPGRRALEEALLRLGRRYTVAMVDVDRFKRFNDRHGHAVGDQALRMVASRLARVGSTGRAYRYGGEEFALLFPRRSLDAVAPHLEAARRAVADAPFRVRGADRPKRKPKSGRRRRRPRRRQLKLTVSIGAADQTSGSGPDEVLKAADRALYQAKRGGRNRVKTVRARR